MQQRIIHHLIGTNHKAVVTVVSSELEAKTQVAQANTMEQLASKQQGAQYPRWRWSYEPDEEK